MNKVLKNTQGFFLLSPAVNVPLSQLDAASINTQSSGKVRERVVSKPASMMIQAIVDEDIDSLSELLTSDLKPQINTMSTGEGDFPLHVAARVKNTEIAKFLVANGAKVNLQNNDGQTALHIAVANKDEDLVDFLLSQDAKSDLADNDGKTAVQLASDLENEAILDKLRKMEEDSHEQPSNANEAIGLAIRSEDTGAIRDIVGAEETDGDIHNVIKGSGDLSLYLAVKLKDTETINQLLAAGANPDEQDDEGNTALHLIAQRGDIAIGRLLQNAKAKPNIVNKDGDTPLHVASRQKHVNIVQLLLNKFSAKINIRNNNGDTPLFVAVRVSCVQAVKDFLNTSQADLDVRTGKSNNGDSLLHLAARNKDPDMAKLLFQWGAPLNAQNNDGRTPLHIAAENGDEDMMKYLHGVKANANISDNDELTPIHLAANRGHQSIVALLMDKFKTEISSRSGDGNTILHYACQAGQLETSVALIKKGVLIHMPNKSGGLCIHEAAKKGHVAIVKMLLEKGVPVDIKNKKGFTPLHLAAVNKKHQVVHLLVGYGADVKLPGGAANETALHMASKASGGEKVVDVLIKSGADPDLTIQNGERALHLASRCGNMEVVRLLLREDAIIARRCRKGRTPVHLACSGGHYGIVKALVDKLFKEKSKPFARLILNVPSDTGETALHSVAGIPLVKNSRNDDYLNIVKILVEHGADLTVTTYHKRETPLHWCARSGNHEIVEAIFTSDVIPQYVKFSIINRTSETGASPLMIASQYGMLNVVCILLRFQARVDVFDEVGATALHYAASRGHVDVARELLNHKAYVNSRTRVGLTPLHIAAEKGYSEFVRMLVTKYNAIVDPLTADKKTPLHLAAEKGSIAACRVLLDLRADASGADSKDMIPVHYAALCDKEEVVELFFRVKPDTLTQVNWEGFNAMQIAASVGSIKVIKKLVELDFAKCSSDKGVLCKPLLLAASGGNTNIVEFLLEGGSSPTEEDMEGMSVLHLAAKFGQLKVLDMLWGKTPIDRISVKNGMTAMHVAAFNGQTRIVQEFLSKAPHSAAIFSQPPAFVEEDEADYGFNALHLAAQNGDNGLVRLITSHPGVRVDALTVKMGRTALHIAAQEGHIEVASTLIGKVASLLHQADKDGCTALHLAATYGHKELITVLIGQGCEVDAQDKRGNTALHAAAEAGYLVVVKLLVEYGATSMIENKMGALALCNAAAERHIEVLDFLLSQKLNHERMLDNRKFLLDLVICSRVNNYQSLMKFILSAPAPIHISSFLSRHYRIEATKNKENTIELDRASVFCETIASELISISCAEDSEAVLNSIDMKDVAFLDFLIECELKKCVSHKLVQQYVTQIWFGELKWEQWMFMLLFLVAFLCPPLWIYLSLPFKNRYRQIPIIKFICRLISHLYLILLLCLTVVVPWRYSAALLSPHWYEYLLYLWIIGILLSEISSERERSGLGWFPAIVVILSLFSEIIRLIALGYSGSQRIDIVFIKNQFLALALMLSVLQLLQFLSIHRLFGPWGVIIGHLVVDVSRFLLILAIFFVGFVLQLSAIQKPLYQNETSYKTTTTDPDILAVVEGLFFGLFGLTTSNQLLPGEGGAKVPYGVKNMTKVVFGVYNILCIIVLINLLIAMMSDTYQRLQEQSDVEWKFGRAKLIRNMERETTNPSPINLFTKVIHVCKTLYQNRCRCRIPGIASAQGRNVDEESDQTRSRKKPIFRRSDRSVEGLAATEWALIYSVVDWKLIVEKYLESKGERIQKAKPGTTTKNKKKNLQVPSTGVVNQGMSLTEIADNTVIKLDVVNAMRV